MSAQKYTGGIVTSGQASADVGKSILEKGGSAVDAAIAALLCDGLLMPHCMGIGGGFFMTIYTRETKTVTTLNARETAPAKATIDMFQANATLATKSGISVAIPGEIRGYWKAHQKFGKLPWPDLIKPAIDLCRDGHVVERFTAEVIKQLESDIRDDPGLKEVYINPQTDKPFLEGEIIKRPKLADTLEIIAKDGADALYNGTLTEKFVADIQEVGGIITVEDMRNYRPTWQNAVTVKLPRNHTLHTFPLPGSGIVLIFILNVLSGFLDSSNFNTVKNWQRITETFKYAYAKRTELGDPGFVEGIEKLINELTSTCYAKRIRDSITDDRTFDDPKHYGANTLAMDDNGTAHISVLAPNGDAVGVTSTVNLDFGARITSKSTGIILNNEMDDFSAPQITNSYNIPPSPANFIAPGKRPMSSMSPSIFVDANGDVILIIGAAGGSKITTSIAAVIIKYLWYNVSLTSAISAPRLHHQLLPMAIYYEKGFDENIIKELNKLGHEAHVAETGGFFCIVALGKKDGVLEGSFDPRRNGKVCLV